MIRHCVFVKFRADVSADERAGIYAGLNALVGQIDGLLSADFGPNVSPEGRSLGFNDASSWISPTRPRSRGIWSTRLTVQPVPAWWLRSKADEMVAFWCLTSRSNPSAHSTENVATTGR